MCVHPQKELELSVKPRIEAESGYKREPWIRDGVEAICTDRGRVPDKCRVALTLGHQYRPGTNHSVHVK